MTKDSALRMALEAFEYIENNYMSLPAPATKAITAIKEALAQPEQEPVALEDVYLTIIQWDVGGGKRSRRELARRIVAKYTAPPQRKPLTDEEIERACVPLGAAMLSFSEVARAIEAAHGIKE